MIFISK